jgi:hypothetical protein
MPRIPMDAFEDGTEIVRVYLAAKLDEAERVERALDAAGVEYAVEAEPYAAPGSLGAWTRTGAGFWVVAAVLDPAADALASAGLTRGLVER